MVFNKIKEMMTPKIKSIKNPKDSIIKVKTVSAMIGRMPRDDNSEYKTVSIKLFSNNNPQTSGEYPNTIYEFSDIEKVRIRRLNVSYYLEGNDLIINDLEELYLIHEGRKLTIKGYQLEVEKRINK